MIPEPRAASRDEVPLLDLSDFDAPGGLERAAQELRKAALSLGFFYVAGHGVPRALCDGVFAATKRYFELPLEEKMKDMVEPRFRRGYMPEGLSQHKGNKPDSKESYELSLDLPLDDPDVAAGRFLHGPNRWPADHPWLRDAVEPYFESVMGLGRRLMQVFAVSLDLPADHFVSLCSKPTMHMRLFHYPPQPPDSADNQFGVSPHCDYGMLTILNQDPIGGLELRKRDGEWVAAPYIEGTFVVNIGDLFKMWTNDLYASTPHRVLNRTGRERYSIPVFFSPNFTTLIECIPSCLQPGTAPKHPPIRSGDYIEGRLRSVHHVPAN